VPLSFQFSDACAQNTNEIQVRLRCEIKRKLFNSTSKACLFEMVPAGSMIYQSLMTAKGAAGGV